MPVRSSLPPGRMVDIPQRGRAWVWDTGGAPDRPTVVLLHGWTSTAALNWSRCFAPLGRHWRVLAMDHRGHGRGIRAVRPFRLEDCADDVAALIRHLDVGPAVVVGYSMGGPVAQLVWRRHPGVVSGLVLCATAGRFPVSSAPALAVAAVGLGVSAALATVPAPLRRRGMERMVRSRPDYASMADWVRTESALGDPVAFVQGAVALNGFDSSRWIERVDVPTAVVVTTEDQTVPPSRQRALADSVPGARVWEVAAGHRACVEAARPFTAALVEACTHVIARSA